MNTQIRKWKALESTVSRVLRVIVIIVAPVLLILLLRFIFTQVDGRTLNSEMSAPFGLGQLAGLCGLIAFLTSAIIQAQKEQGEMRAKVHRTSVKEWLERRFNFKHPQIVTNPSEKKISVNWKDSEHSPAEPATKEIEELCAAGSSDQIFYNLPTEQFCGQIATAVDLVMIAPESYPNFFAALTSGAGTEHQAAVIAFVTTEPLEAGPSINDEGNQTVNQTEREKIEPDEYDRLRARVTNYAQRALDGLQLEATRRWKRQLMFTSLQVSLGISLAVVAIVAPPANFSGSHIWMFAYSTMICGAAGALLAPLAYDITSGIRGLGRR